MLNLALPRSESVLVNRYLLSPAQAAGKSRSYQLAILAKQISIHSCVKCPKTTYFSDISNKFYFQQIFDGEMFFKRYLKNSFKYKSNI